MFEHGYQQHKHLPYPNEEVATHIKKKVLTLAASQVYTSTATIVSDVLQEDIPDNPVPSLSAPANLARAANQHWRAFWPGELQNLDFVFDDDFIAPWFFSDDVHVDNFCHLMFASDKMIQVLSSAKNWYTDATFKVVRPPFTQLFSKHAFVKHDDCVRQVPLMFVVISAKRKKDYKKVLKAVKAILPHSTIKSVMLDLEAAM